MDPKLKYILEAVKHPQSIRLAINVWKAMSWIS